MTTQNDAPQVRRARGRMRVLPVVLVAILLVLALGGVAALALLRDLRAEVEVSEVDELVVVENPTASSARPKNPDDPFAGVPVNILVMGTDFRDDANASFAGEEVGMRSDTTFLVHVAADRSWIQVVSIPRDSMVRIPACNLPGGGLSEDYALGQFNGSFQATGSLSGENPEDLTYGAACTISTFMLNTGLPQPNHLIVKMEGVIGVVNALGGVEVCLAEPIVEDQDFGGLNLPAGRQLLTGEQAISYLRIRHGEGIQEERGDLARIERQQGFVNNLLAQVLSAGTVTNVPTMLTTTRAVLGSISADPELVDAGTLTGLAFSLRGLDPARIVFTTVPNEPWTQNRNRVVWTDEADALWARLGADQPPPELAAATPGPTSSAVAPSTEVPSTEVPSGEVPPADGTSPEAPSPQVPSAAEATGPASGTEPEMLPSVPPGTC